MELHHRGKVVRYNTAQTSDFGLSYLAWYTDITHEVCLNAFQEHSLTIQVHPVTSGHRIVLTYNLISKSSSATVENLEQKTTEYANLIKRWSELKGAPYAYVFALDHAYTNESLSRDLLKGHDVPRAKFLNLAHSCDSSVSTEIVPLLAKMKRIVEDDEDEEYEFDDERPEDTILLSELRTLDGTSLPFEINEILIDFNRVLQDMLWIGRDHDKQTGGQYLGNEYSGVEREFHDAASLSLPKNVSDLLIGDCTSQGEGPLELFAFRPAVSVALASKLCWPQLDSVHMHHGRAVSNQEQIKLSAKAFDSAL